MAPSWDQLQKDLGHEPEASAEWNRWKFWKGIAERAECTMEDLGVSSVEPPKYDGPKTGTPEAEQRMAELSKEAPVIAARAHAETLPLFAKVERGVAKWSSPTRHRSWELDKFQLVLYRGKGSVKDMQVEVANTGEVDLRNFNTSEGELRDRYAGTALVFRRRSGRGVRLDTTFTLE